MKKNIKKVFILILSLIIFSYIITCLFGKTYTVNYKSINENYNLLIDNETGKVDVLDKKKVEDNYFVKVKAKKSGRVYLSLNYGDYQDVKVLYVHKNMVITENSYFGKSTGSEVIPISISVVLIYTLYLLVKNYKSCKQDNIYQYKNIAYLGIIIFLSFLVLNNTFSTINYQGLFESITKIIDSISAFSFLLLPISLITFILVTISNINLIRKEGRSLRNLLGLFLGIFICLLTFLPSFIYKLLMQSQSINIYNLNSFGPYIYNFLEAVIYLIVAYLECILIATIVIAIKSIKKKPKYNKDYIIILGCQIQKDGSLTPLLKGRVNKAIEFRNEQLENTGKDLIFVPSGGKGNDEIISEGEAMKNYLLENGIKEKNILVENKSTNTYENIKFSNKLINNKKANIAFSTTNYHVLRAGLIATSQGLKLEGIGSKTKSYFWINAFIREFIGTLYSERKKHIIMFSLTLIITIIMIWILYIANNM
jgi:uncharacterized SAM-binding protein YcdF (DUF218 family)